MKRTLLFLLTLVVRTMVWAVNYTVSISTSDAEAGYVAISIPKGSVDGYNYYDTDEGGDNISFDVKSGRVITLTPTVNDDALYYFEKWSDDETQNPRTITVTANVTLTAIFKKTPIYTVTVKANPEEGGEAIVSCLDKCADEDENWSKVVQGGKVRLDAYPEDGWRFVRWDDEADDNTEAYRTITPTEDKTYTAKFELIPVYTVTVAADPADKGTVSVSSNNSSNTKEEGVGYVKVYENASVTVKAEPVSGWHFVRWGDDADDNTKATRTITVTSDMNLKATFEQTHYYKITVKANPAEGGEVAIDAATPEEQGNDYVLLEENMTATIYATPEDGWRFLRWDDNDDDNNTKATRKVTATADKTYTANFEEILSGKCGNDLTWAYADGLLTITGAGAMSDFSSAPWDHLSDNILRISLPEGLTTIGKYAFNECGNVTNLIIPASVTSIGNYAIPRCGQLDTLTLLPVAVPVSNWYNVIEFTSSLCGTSDIPKMTFLVPFEAYADYLKSIPVQMAKEVAFIAKETYSGTCGASLTWSFAAKDSTLTISGTGAMTDFSSEKGQPWYYLPVKNIKIENGVTTIGKCAFKECKNVVSVTLPATLTSIGNNAFQSCTALTQITLPANLASIGDSAFKDCTNLKTVYNNSSLILEKGKSTNGYVAYYADEVLNVGIITGTCGENATFKLDCGDGSMLVSGTGAMTDYNNDAPWKSVRSFIKSLVIEDGITHIGSYSFYYCKNLSYVSVPASLESIGEYAFQECDQLAIIDTWGQLVFQKGSTENGSIAFYASQINYKNPIVREGKCGDAMWWSFTSVDGILKIGSGDMWNWDGWRYVPWYDIEDMITSIELPIGLHNIGSYAFYKMKNITSIELPVTLDKIGGNAFWYCENLKTVINHGGIYVKKGSKKHGYVAYYADNVTNDGKMSGTCGDDLKWEMDFSKSKLTISGKGKMYDYEVNNEEKASPWYEFRDLIPAIKFKEGMTYIGKYAFYDTPITELDLPQTLNSIADNAFTGCSSLKNLSVNNTVDLSNGAFRLPSLQTVYVNADRTMERYAFQNPSGSDVEMKTHQVEFVVGNDVKQFSFWNTSAKKLTLQNSATKVKVLSDVAPISKDLVYDVDGDGVLEFVKHNYEVWSEYIVSIIDTVVYDQYGIATELESPLKYDNYTDHGRQLYDNVYINGSKTVLLDINLDGRQDMYEYLPGNDYLKYKFAARGVHYIHYQMPDGSYLKRSLTILTDTAAVDSIIYEKWKNAHSSLLTDVFSEIGIGNGWMVRAPRRSLQHAIRRVLTPEWNSYVPTLPDGFRFIDTAIDLDRDGLVDLMSSSSGAVLYNLGDNIFYAGSFPGKVITKDLNGDGILDYIVYDENKSTVYLYIYEGDGNFKTQTLMQNMNISDVWCYDFDNDGDMDILLPFDYTKKSAYSFLVFFRNDGNNKFTKIENAFEDPHYQFLFLACKDFDNDGRYEVLAVDSIADSGSLLKGRYYLLRHDNQFAVNTELLIPQTAEYNAADDDYHNSINLYKPVIADFNNDGILEYWYYALYDSVYYDLYDYYAYNYSYVRTSYDTKKVNTRPLKPAAPSCILDADRNMLLVSWKAGTDADCSALDLTYSLRIGSAPGKDDFWHTDANADGTQRNLRGGNAGAWTQQWVNVSSWHAGDYYISVQAVDPNGLGSEWSEATVWHHSLLSSDFMLETDELTTADTLLVRYEGIVDPAYTYNWNFGDSVVVIEKNGQDYKLAYNTSGTRTITLQVSDANGLTSPLTAHSVKVNASCFEALEEHLYNASFCDLNQDGIMDAVDNNTERTGVSGVFRGKGDGTFTKIAKTYNTDLTVGQKGGMNFVDWNMDGLPDIVANSNKGVVMLNRGNFDFEFVEKDPTLKYHPRSWYYLQEEKWTFTTIGESDMWRDLDNNGYMDCVNYGYYNNGWGYRYYFSTQPDSASFIGGLLYQYRMIYKDYVQSSLCYDFDMDGDLDVIFSGTGDNLDKDTTVWRIMINQGDGNFESRWLQIPASVSMPDDSYIQVADLNNDGYPDLVAAKNEYTLFVLLGEKNLSYSQYRELRLPTIYAIKEQASLKALRDYDNNGFIDLTYTGVEGAVVVYMSADLQFTCQLWNMPVYPFIDLDGDRVPDVSNARMLTRITNTPPAVPTNLQAVQTEEGILLTWDAADDQETPAAQMRYNVSVKRKGKQVGEDNAFIISPMNGLSNKAAVVPDYPYQHATRMVVPVSRFIVGQQYELQVQAIDLWNEHSDMSAPVTFTVEKQVNLRMPANACTNSTVTVQYVGTEQGKQTWDFDGGYSWTDNDNTMSVQWQTPGIKTVKLTINGTTTKRTINITDNVDLSFSLPQKVLANTWVEFQLPEIFRNKADSIHFKATNIESEQNVYHFGAWITDTTTTYKFMRDIYSLRAKVRFVIPEGKTSDKGSITFFYADPDCGESEYTAVTTIIGSCPKPAIAIVTTDAATGKNKVMWDAPANLPKYVDKVYVYKEEGSINNWIKQGEIAVSAGSWIDMGSDPRVRKARYCISYHADFGAESEKSAVHSSTHLQMNKGLHDAVNLVWTKYEGGTIESYRILRGSTPNNMQIIATVPGTENTYTDLNAPEEAYYALEYDNLWFEKWVWIESEQNIIARRKAAADAPVRYGQSNIMSASESNTVNFAEQIYIRALEDNLELNSQQTELHLYAEIFPATATYRQAAWKIVSGEELATLSDNGLLTAKYGTEGGIVRVRATALDGSGVYAEKDIPVSKIIYLEDLSIQISSIEGGTTLTDNNWMITLQAAILPDNVISSNIVWDIVKGNDLVMIEPDGNQCVVYLNNFGLYGDVVISATAFDYPDVAGFITLHVVNEEEFIPVESILLQSIDGGTVLSENNLSVLIEAVVSPVDATIQDLLWTAVSGADKVTLTPDGNQCIVTLNNNAGSGEVLLRAEALDESGVYGELTLIVETSTTGYTIRFVDWNGALLQESQVQEGEMPVYEGVEPVREEDDQYIWTFIGWTPEIVVATFDADYTAQYDATLKSEGVENVLVDGIVPQRVLIDGVVYIKRGDKLYTLQGQEVK